MQLDGKIALVTGASRGIGRAAAVALAQSGAHVAINYRSHPEEAAAAAAEVHRHGREALLLPGDVADYGAVEAMVTKVVERFGRLDVAVSNAAYSDRELFHEADLAGFRRTIDVTMWGAFHLLRCSVRQMLRQAATGDAPGTVVIVSSPHAFVAVPRSMAYNMAKAAIDQMARTAAIELAPHRIRINTVHPGWIDTPGERKFASEDQIARAGPKLPWGRLGTAEEIARGIVFLCDPKNDYMTGSSLLIDGGITLPWWANRGSAVPE
ncbi:MAG: SDR family oxidoreductase [Planctomycetia bacterium]|nr:SDR family oxidoreductase [Planctomycetia bacterium]